LREGCAVEDFFHPPFIILGGIESNHLNPLRDIYRSVPGSTFETSLTAAEMIKYVCNAFHAVKVCFANEIGTLWKHLSLDTQLVTKIFTSDCKLNISSACLTSGFAFGGSWLPKDLRALQYAAQKIDVVLPLLSSVLPSNAEHIGALWMPS